MNKDEIDHSLNNIKLKNHNKKKVLINEAKKQRLEYKNFIITDVDLIFGIDNGTTGTISAWDLHSNQIYFQETPSVKTLNYQKEINYIERLNFNELKLWFTNILSLYKTNIKTLAILERPMVNPQRFEMSLNAVRAFESLIIILEQLNINYLVIDSKEWQHHFFGKNTILINLKKASKLYGIELLEKYKKFNLNKINDMIEITKKHGDADALLIAKYIIDKVLKYSNKVKESK